MKLRPLSVAIAGLLLVAAPAAQADWHRVTAPGGASTDEVSLLRGGDGVLHVAWPIQSGPNTTDLRHTVISPGGSVGATSPIQTGWAGIENPALVQGADGLRVFFGGQRSTDTQDPNQELNTALSVDGGASWTLQEGSIVPTGGQAYGSPVAAAIQSDGVPIQAWAGTLGTWVHRGLDPLVPIVDLQSPLGQYGYNTGLAAAGGRTVVAWYSNSATGRGVHAQDIGLDGNPSGPARVMPNTSNMTVGMLARTPIVARPGGGFYVAYPTGNPELNRVRLWSVGSGSARTIARTDDDAYATVAAAADGRLWVVWTDTDEGNDHVLATRSNASVSRFGAVVEAGRPNGTTQAYSLNGSDAPNSTAAGGALDLLANYSIGTTPRTATYVTRILPGLTLTASPRRLDRDEATEVTFTVTDAGDPVEGARVSARGRSDRTDEDGHATLELTGSERAITALATLRGYTSARLKLRSRD
jgi:hypothetical protein